MDPISISFVVIGAVILVAEAFKYIRHKFFHRKEENHGESMTLKASELTMDGSDLIKLAHYHNKEELVKEGVLKGQIHAKDIKITFAKDDSFKEKTYSIQSERGGSEVGSKLVDAISGLASPWSGAANIIGNTLEIGANHFLKPKHLAPEQIKKSLSDSQLNVGALCASPSTHQDGCVSVGASPVLERKFELPKLNIIAPDDDDTDTLYDNNSDTTSVELEGGDDIDGTWV